MYSLSANTAGSNVLGATDGMWLRRGQDVVQYGTSLLCLRGTFITIVTIINIIYFMNASQDREIP